MNDARSSERNSHAMNKENARIKSVLKIALIASPFVIGVIFYYPYYNEPGGRYPLLDAAYAALKLYTGDAVEGIDTPLILHIAKFAAMFFALSLIISVLDKSKQLLDYFRAGSEKNYVVYGRSAHAAHLCRSIGSNRCVSGVDEFIENGRNYVLMFSDDNKNLEFYAENYDKMKDNNVYIRLENIKRQNIDCKNVVTFSIYECCARLYWRENYPVSSEKIALIGFGCLGQNMLTFGLQMNIIDRDQHFEYHIWGESGEFRELYRELDRIDLDEIVFHGADPFADAKLISGCDRIIICSDGSDNIEILSKLLFCMEPSHAQIDIYSPDQRVIETIYGGSNIRCFGRSEEVADMDVIINQKTLDRAVRQHEYYVRKYGGEHWDKQNSFIKYSNISSADYTYVIERLYNEKHMNIEEIAELEHIRWCRYYYLNNWRYGADRNDAQRIHDLLLPFDNLSQEDIIKDIEAVKVKLTDEM